MQSVTMLTQWTQIDGANTPIMPTLKAGEAWEDVTGQDALNISPDPNIVMVRATLTDASLAAVEADARFCVLSAEEVPDETKR